MADPRWRRGVAWGTPRSGHPEGAVIHHIVAVLENVDRVALDDGDRARLRLIALVHDTFKCDVDRSRPAAATTTMRCLRAGSLPSSPTMLRCCS
jgi:hypothetical protein